MRLARRYFISGLVQGVGFRYYAYRVAQKHHITGYARNLDDGRVEVQAEGEEENLSRFINELWTGPRLAVVKDVQVEEIDFSNLEDFRIE